MAYELETQTSVAAPELPSLQIGHGYDVHQFAQGRELILGGVHIEHKLGLMGHSDADVVAHALTDAILGACRMQDIGALFPDTDPAYKGADSLKLLSAVMEQVHAAGFELVDADCTIAAQAPKLAPYRDLMRKNLADACGVSLEHMGVKATTTEHLGFVGREEGIAAWASVIVWRKSKDNGVQ